VKSDESVQAALARAPDGGTVWLPYGTFRSSIRIDRPLKVRAHPRGTTLDGKGMSGPILVIAPGVTGVEIEGVRLQNGGGVGLHVGEGATDVSLVRLLVVRCAGDGLRVEAGAGVRIDRCVLEENGGDGLGSRADDLVALRVTALRNGGAGLRLQGADARVEDAILVGGGVGIALEGERARLSRCRFVDLTLAVGFASGSSENELEGADARRVGTFVVCEPGSRRARVLGCRVTSTSADALEVRGEDHLLAGNLVAGAGGDGIFAEGQRIAILANVVEDVDGAGVCLRGDEHVVDGNLLADAVDEGVHLLEGRANRITDNRVRGCGGRGIADDGVDTVLHGNRIE
jgi:nitrous oxidase accessory protein NosD